MEEDVRDWKRVAALKKGRVWMPHVRPSQAIIFESQWESCSGCGRLPWGGVNAQAMAEGSEAAAAPLPTRQSLIILSACPILFS